MLNICSFPQPLPLKSTLQACQLWCSSAGRLHRNIHRVLTNFHIMWACSVHLLHPFSSPLKDLKTCALFPSINDSSTLSVLWFESENLQKNKLIPFQQLHQNYFLNLTWKQTSNQSCIFIHLGFTVKNYFNSIAPFSSSHFPIDSKAKSAPRILLPFSYEIASMLLKIYVFKELYVKIVRF